MSKYSSQDTHTKNPRIIDFLEDQDFRNWVLKSGAVGNDSLYWKKLVQNNLQARKAKYILLAMKMHFDQNQMSNEEIEDQLHQEIDKYRFPVKKSGMNLVGTDVLWRTAAVFVLLVGLLFLVRWMNRPLDIYTTGYGERLTIQLPDESVIQLNSNSRLTWNRAWEKGGERVIDLAGEAFFDVKHLNGLPFLVQTDDILVNVTGTQFNVNSRRQKTMVYLDEGKVNIALRERPQDKYEMEPGEELIYSARTGQIEQKRVEEPEVISGWKEGVLVFREEPLMKVLESISDIYGKEFVTKDTALLHRNITTTIPLTNWDVSLTAIQLAMRLEVEEMKDTVRINRLENK